MTSHSPEDLFRAEKERSQSERGSTHAQLLAEAKAAFDKLMAEGQAARKSGRPRKNPPPPLLAAVPAVAVGKKPVAANALKKRAAKAPAKKPARPAKKSAPKKAAKKSAARKPAKKHAAKKAAPRKPGNHGKRR
ncbi:MAG: hypothetical protein WBQ26_14375 [Gemmatimonadaceae bacterium]|nr:hypothetical protein [Gemmatimonadaceae bacterium]